MGAIFSSFFSYYYYIKNKRFNIVKKIGEGAFSYVYLVKYEQNLFAIKHVPLQMKEREEMIMRELSYSGEFEHPNIMKFYDYEIKMIKNAKEAFILMPYFEPGSLGSIHRSLLEEEFILLILKISSAMQYLHEQNPPIAHHDIKPGNILFDIRNINFVLIDFGSMGPANINVKDSCHALELQEFFDSAATPEYRAPELFNIHTNTIISEKTDVWSFGVTLYQIRYGFCPLEGTALSAIQYTLKLPSPETSKIKQLFTMTIQRDPNKRCYSKNISKIFRR